MNRDSVTWQDMIADLDFLFTFAALPDYTALKDMEQGAVRRLCNLVKREWVEEFDACDPEVVPTLTKTGRELYFILNGTEVIKELKERNHE